MKQAVVLTLLAGLFPAATLAVDKTSSAYGAGKIAGYVVIAIIVILIIRKLFNK